jgi:threonine dehydratase
MRTELPTFKHRGISLFVQRALCASGGHMGLAASSAAQELGVPCMTFLPHGVDARTQAFLRTVGANVVVSGFYVETLHPAEVAVQTRTWRR